MRKEMNRSEQNASVLVETSVINKINKMIHRDPYRECGGLFLGNVSRDEVTDKYTVHVKDLYYEDISGTAGSFEFDIDYKSRAVSHVKRNCVGESHIIGDVHSHAQFGAFFSGVDEQTQMRERSNYLYMVVSPSQGTWVMRFKDIDFKFHECDVKVVGGELGEYSFNKVTDSDTRDITLRNKKCKVSSFRTDRYYSDTQKKELDKRFLHSINELKDKKVLIVGAGTIGNLLAEYCMNSGIGDITTVDLDTYQYWNLPRSSMVGEDSLGKPKATELARAIAQRSCFSVRARGINADICDLGWGFLSQFDLVMSPVDNAAIRQYIDRGCKLYGIPHITCGTGIVDGDFTGNVIAFPADARVDLEYVWGTGYREKLNEHRSCSEIAQETQAQVMGFSSQIAGIAMDIALKYLLGRSKDGGCVTKYILNAVGHGIVRDKCALRVYKYANIPAGTDSELYSVFKPGDEMPTVTFDRARPKHELWETLKELFGEDIASYRLDLEWSLNIPVAYHSVNACAMVEVAQGSGVDPTLMLLPPRHVYLVEGDDRDYLLEIVFEEEN